MRVALFGGTGFVGSYVCDKLVAAGHELALLVRQGSEHKVRQSGHARLVTGSIDDHRAIEETLDGCGAAIYLVGILREDPSRGLTFRALQYDGATRVIDAARRLGIPRFLLMSANGVKPDGNDYQRTKYEAERYLADSGLSGTVFRPSVVFGNPRGRMEFCTQLRDQVLRPPLPAPLFFSGLSPAAGSFDMSPVWVEDVAEAFVRSLADVTTAGEVSPLGGAETLSWRQILERIAEASGRRKLYVPVPVAPVAVAATLLQRFPFFPMTRDQLDMLMEGNVVESDHAFSRLGIAPAAMTVDRLSYLRL